MTFTYNGADLSKTIKNFSKDGNCYHIMYMDGSENFYYCSDPLEEENLYQILLEQVLERDVNMQIKELQINKSLLQIITILSSYLLAISIKEKESVFTLISILLEIFSIEKFKEKVKKIKELQKYKIYVEIMDRVKNVNQTELLKCIEFEPLYQKPLDLNNLDEFTLGDIKRIRTFLPKLEQKNNGN